MQINMLFALTCHTLKVLMTWGYSLIVFLSLQYCYVIIAIFTFPPKKKHKMSLLLFGLHVNFFSSIIHFVMVVTILILEELLVFFKVYLQEEFKLFWGLYCHFANQNRDL